jgi:purine-binding chemotaxis protein CheW
MSLRLFSGLNRQIPEVERKIVKFAVGPIHAAVDIMHVREIILPREISAVASEDKSIIGILDHRDAAIPVVDLRRRFKSGDTGNQRQKWIIIAIEEKIFALVVDSVFGVMKVQQNQQRDRSALGATDVRWAAEVYGDSDGLIFEIDLVQLANSISSN